MTDEVKFLYVGPQGPKCFPEMQLWKEICLERTEFLARYLLSGYIVVSKKVLFYLLEYIFSKICCFCHLSAMLVSYVY